MAVYTVDELELMKRLIFFSDVAYTDGKPKKNVRLAGAGFVGQLDDLGHVGTYLNDLISTQAFMFIDEVDDTENPGDAYFVFRGTEPDGVGVGIILDWWVNSKTNLVDFHSWVGDDGSKAKVHKGFFQAIQTHFDEMFQELQEILATGISTIYFTGHSLGGALTYLFIAQAYALLSTNERTQLVQSAKIVTFGAPAVGNEQFRDRFDEYFPDAIRVVNGNDPVPDAPFFVNRLNIRVPIWSIYSALFNMDSPIDYSNPYHYAHLSNAHLLHFGLAPDYVIDDQPGLPDLTSKLREQFGWSLPVERRPAHNHALYNYRQAVNHHLRLQLGHQASFESDPPLTGAVVGKGTWLVEPLLRTFPSRITAPMGYPVAAVTPFNILRDFVLE